MGNTHGKQAGQHGGSGSQHAGAGSCFHRFQVHPAFPLSGENYLEECLDFACDFMMNGNSRFFSSSVQPVS